MRDQSTITDYVADKQPEHNDSGAVTPHVEIIRKPFDPDFYDWQIRIALGMNESTQTKRIKLRSLVERAYEQGIIDTKNKYNYYED